MIRVVILRRLDGPGEYRAAEEIQRRVWHFPWREVIPLNELVVAQKNGGHVFGAFDRSRLVAFCFGVPAFRDGKVYHYSRMLGVLPKYQNRGLGERLKRRQREYVLEQGLELIRWTFDPLQGRNANLNIEKLGCIVREYAVNIYPGSGSRFNRGLDTDRFVVEWWIRSRRVRDRLEGLGRTRREEASALPAATFRSKEPRVCVEIPHDIDAIKRRDLDRARRWRRATREIFQTCFRRGYVLTGFAAGRKGEPGLYVLEKGTDVP